ncbi:tRNA(Ile)-lysidine synthase [Candidatus Sulfobium mesophilum]|uniref:tRNA(Ile)-lysidine synthase n=1 Tax=Candidatus Sulfobium mesophilum TaxID=2016548 RepID=A0A2U3QHF7_9BACT|nr:tRNA(Ile)-lysidine synthase [Candidatus Sulfobium mesophilum]
MRCGFAARFFNRWNASPHDAMGCMNETTGSLRKTATMKATAEPNSSLRDRVIYAINKYGMLSGGETVLVGLSGGPDSVCLLSILADLRGSYGVTLHAVYVNHNLRPGEVGKEIKFCEDFCREKGVNFLVKSVDVLSLAKTLGLNKQEAARQLRYRAFDEAATEVEAARIALAHNADDQIETICMRFLRGAGPAGLSGMPLKRGNIIRPLIEIERADIESYLAAGSISFVVDSSNLGTEYFRNKIRQVLVPVMKELNPSLAATMTHTSHILREEERYFSIVVTKALMKMISRKTKERIELFLAPMESMDTVILRRVLRRAIEETDSLRGINFTHVEDIINLVRRGSSGDRLSLPRGIRVIRGYSLLIITLEAARRIDEYELRPPAEVAVRGTGTVIRASLDNVKGDACDGRSSVLLDADAMKFPLKIRPRTAGDFFFPLGFGKRKKLQDFFVDAKVPRDERDMIPIVVSGDDIVWVAGYRADDRFRVHDSTEKFLRLDVVKGNF